MATYYWDYWNDTSTSTTGGNYYSGGTGSTWTQTTTTSTSTNGFFYYIPVRIERYLVSVPKFWDKTIRADFTKLINHETRSHGFTVEMWIDGDVAITDHSIQRRTMEEFRLLLRQYSSIADWELFEQFFQKHPPVDPPISPEPQQDPGIKTTER